MGAGGGGGGGVIGGLKTSKAPERGQNAPAS